MKALILYFKKFFKELKCKHDFEHIFDFGGTEASFTCTKCDKPEVRSLSELNGI